LEDQLHGQKENSQTEEVNRLVDRAIGGDTAAYGELYDLYITRVYSHVFYRVRNSRDAEDLAQQVFINAWKAIRRYKRTSTPFIAWLLKIAHNLVVDFYHSKKIVPSLEESAEIPSREKGPQDIAELKFDQEKIRNAILRLPDKQQQVIIMKFIEGFSYEEIAAVLNKSQGAVRVIQHRALRELKLMLEGEIDPG
jgi:RNA polymerase sigma-70 factor (ECF subfamily)